MTFQDKQSNLYWLYLFLGAGSYVLLALDVLQKMYPESGFQLGFSDFWRSILLAWFVIFHYLFLREFSESREIFNVERLLAYILLSGIIACGVYFGSGYLATEGYASAPQARHMVYFARHYVLIVYFLAAMTLFKKLIFVQKTRLEILLWNLFQGMFITSLLFSFPWPQMPDPLILAYTCTGLLLVLALVTRLKWIGLLGRRARWTSLLLLAAVNTVTFLLARELYQWEDIHLLQADSWKNVFLTLSAAQAGLYGAFAMLTLLFHLPVAGLMEERSVEMSSFQEINRIIQGSFREEEIFEKLFRAAMQHTKAEAGWLEMNYGRGGQKQYFLHTGIEEPLLYRLQSVMEGTSSVSPGGGPAHYYVRNMKKHPLFRRAGAEHQSLLAFPVHEKDGVSGRLVLLKSFTNGFDEYMIRLAGAYIAQTGVALEKAGLLEEALEKERLREELAIARSVQQKLIPAAAPALPGCEIACHNEPAREVGGDYYDFYRSGKDSLSILVSDVSGKGTSAAFHMAEVKGIFHGLIRQHSGPAQFLSLANEAVGRCFERGSFVTATFLKVDSGKKTVELARAGHCPTLLYSASTGKAKYLKDNGTALGILRNGGFEKHLKAGRLKCRKGDALVLYTDGITEARKALNGSFEEYGYGRLQSAVERAGKGSADGICRTVLDDLARFTGGKTDFDDVTLVVVKFV